MIINKTKSLFTDNLRQLFFVFLSLNLLAFSGLAQSMLVFNQAPLDGGDGPASFFEEQSADNFSLTADTEITGIQWWGSFVDDVVSEPLLDNLFDIRFFNDNSGLPVNNASESFSVTVQGNTTGLFDLFGGDVFRFEASLTPFNLLANTEYYVSIVHPNDVLNDEFFWLQSDDIGTNFTRNINAGVNNDWEGNQFIPGNLAFSLLGNQAVVATVPEPSVLVLFALVFLGFTAYRRATV